MGHIDKRTIAKRFVQLFGMVIAGLFAASVLMVESCQHEVKTETIHITCENTFDTPQSVELCRRHTPEPFLDCIDEPPADLQRRADRLRDQGPTETGFRHIVEQCRTHVIERFAQRHHLALPVESEPPAAPPRQLDGDPEQDDQADQEPQHDQGDDDGFQPNRPFQPNRVPDIQ